MAVHCFREFAEQTVTSSMMLTENWRGLLLSTCRQMKSFDYLTENMTFVHHIGQQLIHCSIAATEVIAARRHASLLTQAVC